MTDYKRVYLSIGSNLLDKKANLQAAIDEIHLTTGEITNISSIYKTPSWGFEGEDFYNICIELQSNVPASPLLKKLLEIETLLGRKRGLTEGYQDRLIDIDMVLYENIEINTDFIALPHPKAVDRKFVLYPLREILSLENASINRKNIDKLIDHCIDKSPIEKVSSQVLETPQKGYQT
ncbi:2-amino-4-hydroxy-6-hydroxymethyldihydropteridine diphosphokinase [Flavicella marina]|uniref:2-amino-4-hydroxy-6- hydroxymethyldihydropteridine diphosphokinase n=1 Tax=Flavicella marina TaxID=1475951 RepID=UPI0012657443|nr:2-amino-4-hydroxy-6-hydroxymethyldihydropteridine diphosphokinase [Flavicella marina]